MVVGNKEELLFSSKVKEFNFSGESIDTSLRKVLCKLMLPKEAQQIGRSIEVFSSRYYQCNPTLADSPDIVFAVAYSLLMLHTDAHNKNIKQKMNKDSFIVNTKLIEGGESAAPEILDVMYDNIVASEFIYADQQLQREKSNSWFSIRKNTETSNILIDNLSQKLEHYMPAENTLNYKLTLKPIPIMDIHLSLLKAKSLCLSGVKSRHSPTNTNNTYTIRVTKAGLMDRKCDLMQDGKKAPTRAWRPFGVILSGTQLIFFADIPAFQSYLYSTKRVNSFPLISQTRPPIPIASSSTNTQQTYLRPVQIVSLDQAVCIHDESYTKYPNVFRLILKDGQQFLLRTDDMNDWMLKTNYAAALKSTGIHVLKQDRQQKIKQEIELITEKLHTVTRQLDYNLQLRRNLMVLVPCQKSTKDRILTFADATGKRIKSQRIQLQRLECYRDYLECELSRKPILASSASSFHMATSSSESSLSSGGTKEEDFKSLNSHDETTAPQLPAFSFPKTFMESVLNKNENNRGSETSSYQTVQ